MRCPHLKCRCSPSTEMTACTRVSVLAALVSQSLVARAGVPVCNHDTMADNAFCFPPEYNKVMHISSFYDKVTT